MKVVVRTDASISTGHGHVMRCLTLASALRERQADVSFVCREQPGHLCDYIDAQGFHVSRIQGDDSLEADLQASRRALLSSGAMPEWLVVDHYQLDARWEQALRADVRNVLVIDDLADRPHDCDLLLDQNYFSAAAARYAGLIPVYCHRFLGPEHVLLREEFRSAQLNAQRATPSRILVFFGGGDPTGQSAIALEAVLKFDASLAVDLIVGQNNPHAESIERRCQGLPQIRVIRHTERIAALMARATLCLGAGGIATFERIYMQLPSIVVSTAENQCEPLQALAEMGCIDYLGRAADVTQADWEAALSRWRAGELRTCALRVGSRAERVIGATEIELEPFAERHIRSTFTFLEDAALRASFAIREAPEWERHVRYWQDKLERDEEHTFAIERRGVHVGNCGIKPIPGENRNEGWIYLAPGLERRSGVGEIAFRRLLRRAFRELGLSSLALHVRRDNTAALALYAKIGFREDARTVDTGAWGERAAGMCRLVIVR